MNCPAITACSKSVTAEDLPVDVALSRHGDDWRRLAAEAADSTLFMHPAVTQSWAEGIAPGHVRPSVAIVREKTRLLGVLPLMRARMWRGPALVPRLDYAPYDTDLAPGTKRVLPVRQLASLVSWRCAAVRPTALALPRDRPVVLGALAPLLARSKGVDQIVLPTLDGADAALWQDAFGRAGVDAWVHRSKRPVLTLQNVRPVEELIAGASRNFRRRIARARNAAQDCELTFEVLAGPAARTGLPLVAEVAKRSWKAAAPTPDRIAIPYAGPQQSFIEGLLEKGSDDLDPVLILGRIAGEPVVATLCLRHGDCLTPLVTFRTDAAPEASPGLLSLAAAIDWAAEAGIARIDWNATQDWLRPLADRESSLCTLVAFLPTLRGRLYDRIARRRAGLSSPAELGAPDLPPNASR